MKDIWTITNIYVVNMTLYWPRYISTASFSEDAERNTAVNAS